MTFYYIHYNIYVSSDVLAPAEDWYPLQIIGNKDDRIGLRTYIFKGWNDDFLVYDAVLKLTQNESGILKFKIPKKHICWERCYLGQTIWVERVYKTSGNVPEVRTIEWKGFISNISTDFDLTKEITCTGLLGVFENYLCTENPGDSPGILSFNFNDILKDIVYDMNASSSYSDKELYYFHIVNKDNTYETFDFPVGTMRTSSEQGETIAEYLRRLIETDNSHNGNQVEAAGRPGYVNLYNLKLKFIKTRIDNDTIYDAYLFNGHVSDFDESYRFEYGKNIIDITVEDSLNDVFDTIAPYGSNDEFGGKIELDVSDRNRSEENTKTIFNIKDEKNNNFKYRFFKKMDFSDAKDSEELIEDLENEFNISGSTKLTKQIKRSLSIKAIDPAFVGFTSDYNNACIFDVGRNYKVISEPHDINEWIQIKNVEIPLDEPWEAVISTSKEMKISQSR